jgi:hypothetical protein
MYIQDALLFIPRAMSPRAASPLLGMTSACANYICTYIMPRSQPHLPLATSRAASSSHPQLPRSPHPRGPPPKPTLPPPSPSCAAHASQSAKQHAARPAAWQLAHEGRRLSQAMQPAATHATPGSVQTVQQPVLPGAGLHGRSVPSAQPGWARLVLAVLPEPCDRLVVLLLRLLLRLQSPPLLSQLLIERIERPSKVAMPVVVRASLV